MTPIECLRNEARTAANLALSKYPKPIAEVLHEQLNAWSDQGHRLGSHGKIRLLIDEINKVETAQNGTHVQNAS